MTDISKIKSDRIDDGIKPGDICYSLRTEKTGWLLCDGSEYSRIDYANLFAIIGTTFGQGDGSTTFNVPNYSGRFLMMDSTKTIGTNIEAGLPDHIHTSLVASDRNGNPDGGADSGGGRHYWRYATTQYNTTAASADNSIYGNSTTVQPPASIVNYFIKY